MLSPFPPPITQTSYLQPQHPPCPLSQVTTIRDSTKKIGRLNHGRSTVILANSAQQQRLIFKSYLVHALTTPHTYPSIQHPCMQALSTTHSHPPHSMSANLIKLCSGPRNIPLREGDYIDWRHNLPDVSFELQRVNPQPWRFTNNSLSFPEAHSLSVCLFLWFCVVCVYFDLMISTCLSACVVSAACFVLGFYLHVYYSDSCVCVPKQAHAFPLSSIFAHISFTFIRIFLYSQCSIFILIFLFSFFFLRNIIDTCVTLSIDVIMSL